MAKITVRAVTRLQKFLAAIAGDGAAPNPITDKEKLLHNIAENVNNGGGSGGGVLVVTDTNGTLDKTWQEIHDAFVSDGVRIQYGTDTNALVSVLGVQYSSKSGEYLVTPSSAGSWQPELYVASSADGYPTNN